MPTLMNLREFLLAVGTGYDMHHGFATPQHALLDQAGEHLWPDAPVGMSIEASGGQRQNRPTATPWIRFFDPDTSPSPQSGMYVVYLLRADSSAWTISINMGTENQRLDRLRDEADRARSALPSKWHDGWDTTIDLRPQLMRSRGSRQQRYQAATVLGRTYLLSDFPTNEVLAGDLRRLCVALDEVLAAGQLPPGRRATTVAPTTLAPRRNMEPELVFEPGTDKAVYVKAPSSTVFRNERHEGGLQRYGDWLKSKGFEAGTNRHPCDLIVRTPVSWIVEYKVVYGSDITRATRDAFSQLKEYRYFDAQYADSRLLAAFSAPIGQERIQWLNSESIAVVWDEDGVWRGCPLAISAGLGLDLG